MSTERHLNIIFIFLPAAESWRRGLSGTRSQNLWRWTRRIQMLNKDSGSRTKYCCRMRANIIGYSEREISKKRSASKQKPSEEHLFSELYEARHKTSEALQGLPFLLFFLSFLVQKNDWEAPDSGNIFLESFSLCDEIDISFGSAIWFGLPSPVTEFGLGQRYHSSLWKMKLFWTVAFSCVLNCL